MNQPPSPFRALLSDFFGTLVPNFSLSAHKNVLRQMATAVGAPAEPFVEHWLATFHERALGIFPTTKANIEAVCRQLNITPAQHQYETAMRLRLDFEQSQIVPRPNALSTLQAVRALGLKTCLVSDCSMELPQLWDQTPFAPLFDAAVFSCTVNLRKPSREIYLEACRRLDVQPAQCVYVGDGGSRELTGAQAAGMTAIMLISPEEQNNPDTHRIEGEDWPGPTISDLKDVLPFLQGYCTGSHLPSSTVPR